MSKSNFKMPVMGQPVWVISEQPLDERISVVGERGILNTLVYFAPDAIMVVKMDFEDETMTKLVINQGLKHKDDETKSLEVRLDIRKASEKEPDGTSVFADEDEANAVAIRLNENQKKQAKKLFDLFGKAYNEYDQINGTLRKSK